MTVFLLVMISDTTYQQVKLALLATIHVDTVRALPQWMTVTFVILHPNFSMIQIGGIITPSATDGNRFRCICAAGTYNFGGDKCEDCPEQC